MKPARIATALVAAALAAAVAAPTASAGPAKLAIKAPKSVKVDQQFRVVVSGRAKEESDLYLFYAYHHRCAKDVLSAIFDDRDQQLFKRKLQHGRFQQSKGGLSSQKAGKSRLCAYLIGDFTNRRASRKVAFRK